MEAYENKLYENIKKFREEKGLTQDDLAKLAGYTSRTSIAKIERGQVDLPQSRIAKFAEIFGLTETELMGRNSNNSSSNLSFFADPIKPIPILGSVPAGVPVEAIEDIIGTTYIPESWTKSGQKYIGLKVKGSSMYPKYMDGDTIIVRIQEDWESGQDCVVYVNGYEATLKTLVKNADGKITLRPINPEYEPKTYGPNDNSISILGVVKQLVRNV